jgi:hypothetical protein
MTAAQQCPQFVLDLANRLRLREMVAYRKQGVDDADDINKYCALWSTAYLFEGNPS